MIQPARNLPPRPELQIKSQTQPQQQPSLQASAAPIPVVQKSLLSRILPTLGTIAVAGGLAALGWFAYMERKKPVAIEELPIIKAEETPYKTKPEDPGGMEFPHRDKQIYDAIAGEAPKDSMKIEDILPPPEEPVVREDLKDHASAEIDAPGEVENKNADISQDAAPLAEKNSVPAMPPLPQTEASLKNSLNEAAPELTQGDVLSEAISDKDSVSEETATTVATDAPGPVASTEPIKEAGASPPPAVATHEVTDIPVALPMQPQSEAHIAPSQPERVEVPLEPAKTENKSENESAGTKKPIKTTVKSEVKKEKKEVASLKSFSVLPASMAGRGFKLQLGSYKDMENLKKGWAALQKRHPKELAALSYSIDKISLGGKGMFFRLQAGTVVKEADARRLCNELIAQKQGCIVVRPKK